MAILLDTNILIEFLRRVPVAVAWLDEQTDRLTISAVTVLELYAGARRQREERDIVAVCQRLACLPVGREIAERAGALMRHFHVTHGIDVPDAIIAATSEQHGLRLATLNVKHFPMFPKLKRPY
jgi:predicted nucleic acid-binding protein